MMINDLWMIEDFDTDYLTGVLDYLDDQVWTIEDLGHGNNNLVACIQGDKYLAVTVIDGNTYAGTYSEGDGDFADKQHPGPNAYTLTPQQVADWCTFALECYRNA